MLVRRGGRLLPGGQREEVGALRPVESKHVGDARERVCGRLDVASLFEPRVPTDAHAGQERHFLAAEAERAPRPALQSQVTGV